MGLTKKRQVQAMSNNFIGIFFALDSYDYHLFFFFFLLLLFCLFTALLLFEPTKINSEKKSRFTRMN